MPATRLFARSIACAALLACALPAWAAAAAAPGALTVTAAEGEVEATPGDGSGARAVSAGDALQEGDTVRTGADSRVEVAFGSGTVIRLGPSTQAVLHEAPAAGGRFRLKLLLGNFWAKVSKLSGGERFEVETENGVAGVRGTEFRAERGGGDQEDLLRVYEGKVEVAHHGGKWTHSVEPGSELRFHHARGTAGPRKFDPRSEQGHPLMRWVRARGPKAHPLVKRPGPGVKRNRGPGRKEPKPEPEKRERRHLERPHRR
jgi:hypothetical protein